MRRECVCVRENCKYKERSFNVHPSKKYHFGTCTRTHSISTSLFVSIVHNAAIETDSSMYAVYIHICGVRNQLQNAHGFRRERKRRSRQHAFRIESKFLPESWNWFDSRQWFYAVHGARHFISSTSLSLSTCLSSLFEQSVDSIWRYQFSIEMTNIIETRKEQNVIYERKKKCRQSQVCISNFTTGPNVLWFDHCKTYPS